jgi:hypothetical protein
MINNADVSCQGQQGDSRFGLSLHHYELSMCKDYFAQIMNLKSSFPMSFNDTCILKMLLIMFCTGIQISS